ncbi:arylesterase [Sphingomonas sp. ID0503]|uniref:arylesterase n=1 Tax=Sphingomonas sp. ID0503 TaxID=3399691 RepID=UPI003AFA028C
MSLFRRYGLFSGLVYALALLVAGPAFAAPAPLTIWAFGDSLTAGYGLPPRDGFTAQLQAALRKDGLPVTVRNGGISGDTAAQGWARLRWGLRGLKVKPDLVIVELGANDMLRGLPPAQTAKTLDQILTELKRRNIPVLLAGMRAAPNLGPAYRRRFEDIYPMLAKRHAVPLYPFFLAASAGNPALTQPDGIHPNAKGVAANLRLMLPAVKKALPRTR